MAKRRSKPDEIELKVLKQKSPLDPRFSVTINGVKINCPRSISFKPVVSYRHISYSEIDSTLVPKEIDLEYEEVTITLSYPNVKVKK